MLNFQIEQDFRKTLGKDTGFIAGVDEAGRGALAGPVVAAAVIFTKFDNNDDLYSSINDSKKLTPLKREKLYDAIQNSGAYIGVGIIDNNLIDKFNILNATFMAMNQALNNIKTDIDGVVIDGNKVPKDIKFPAIAVIKGDAKSLSVAAASIIAKVTRDHIMMDLAKEYPKYEWNINKGYGTSKHYELLKNNGPCRYHRLSFKLNRQSSHEDNQFRLLFPNL